MRKIFSLVILVIMLVGCTPKHDLEHYVLEKVEEYAESDLRGYEIIGYEIVRYQTYEYKNDEEYFENFRVTLLTNEGKTFSYNVYIGYSKGADGNRLKESDITNVRVSYNN